MKPIHHRLAVAGLLASMGLAAFAQGVPAAGPASPADRGSPEPHSERHARPDPKRAEDFYARRTARLKILLQLTPAQEGAWTQFTTALAPAAQPQGRAPFDPAEFQKLTTPERLDRLRALRQEHAARTDQRDQAIKTFYATLNPSQQKVFDTEALPHHRPGGWGRGGPQHPGQKGWGWGPGGDHGGQPRGPQQ